MVISLDAAIEKLPALPSQLEELTFHSALAKHINPISALAYLRTLNLEECHGLEDLTPVQACTAFEVLNVHECYDLESWPDLRALKSLRELRLGFSTGLDDWSVLTALTALTTLTSIFKLEFDAEVLNGLTQLLDLTLI